MTKVFLEGERLQITYEVDGPDGPVDPEILRLVLKDRFDEPITFEYNTDTEIIRTAAGRYLFESYSIPAGAYKYEWQARGAVQDTLRGAPFEIKKEL